MTFEKDHQRKSYSNPLANRYASKSMSYLFSEENRIINWRKLWITLAKSERALGLDITEQQIKEMEENLENIDYDLIGEEEKRLRHDVMSNVYAFARICPLASPIMHLGATSCFVTDNTDLIIMKEALKMLTLKITSLIATIKDFCLKNIEIPCLGYTHFQTAQLVTVGKRGCLWLQDLLQDLRNLERLIGDLKFRGAKGTTGTQASFLSLFKDDAKKVFDLDEMVARASGFGEAGTLPICGQTYSRKIEVEISAVLASFAASANKIAVDLRLLAHLKEVEEPFESNQIGSSAMAYKRNPMRAERVCSLARHLMTLMNNSMQTAANQWLERTLDDSANRRITISESFLTADAILIILNNIFSGIIVNEAVIKQNVKRELPFMVTEKIIMAMVMDGAGADRQECHEKIRLHSLASHERMKSGESGGTNDLFERIAGDPYFKPILSKLDGFKDASCLIGCCKEQVSRFVENFVDPALRLAQKSEAREAWDLTV